MIRRGTVAALPVLLISACSFFASKPSRFYSLERIAPAAGVRALSGAPIGIDAAELPPGLDRKEVVVRQAEHRLEVRGREQWTATFGQAVLYTLASDLASRLPDGMVVLPGAVKPPGPMRSLNVAFEEIAAGPEPKVVIDARWGIGIATRRERIEVTIPSLGSPDVADGMSRAIAELADRIAAGL